MSGTLFRAAGAVVAIVLLAACANSTQEKPKTAANAMQCQMDSDMPCGMDMTMTDMKGRMSAMQEKMKMGREMMSACAKGRPCDMDKMMKDMGEMHAMMGMMMQQMGSMSQGQTNRPGQQDDHATHQHDAPK